VVGALAARTGSETVTVSGTRVSTTPADLYTDAAWSLANEVCYTHDAKYFGNIPGMTKARWRESSGDEWPTPLQALDRIPKFLARALVGANAGDASCRIQAGGCY